MKLEGERRRVSIPRAKLGITANKTHPVSRRVKERKGRSDDAARDRLLACGRPLIPKETSNFNVALDFDLDLESGQIVSLIHADLVSRVGMDCTCYFLSALQTPYEGHAAEPFCWLTLWRDQLGSSCASSRLLRP